MLLQTFWKSGYNGTSVPDLENATGLTRKSLYNAFGDKREMFVDALRGFRGTVVSTNTAPLRAPDASIDTISALLNGLAAHAEFPEGRAGCMICNTAREPIREDQAVQAEIDAYFADLSHLFRTAILNGQRKGDIRDGPSEELAALCLGALVSICVLGKAGQPAPTLKSIASATVAALT